jgi:phosphoribosylformylglycinamidine (FGAM) synthase-like amidotransferase family enzyme
VTDFSQFPRIDRAAAADLRVLVLTGYGLNCEAETAAGFRWLGAQVDLRHVADVLDGGDEVLRPYGLIAFIGGFSFGDHVGSGRVLANRLRHRLGDRLRRFVADGGLCLGICNGFQTLIKIGLLPGGDGGDGPLRQAVSLVDNDRLGYWDAWVRLAIDPASPCVFTRGLADAVVEFPSRHGEGKLVFGDAAQRAVLEDRHLVPVRYADVTGAPTEAWPDNPDGSPGGAAGLCDASGRVFGLMPHPEAYLYPENHPRWISQRAAGTLPAVGLGLHLLANGVRAAITG